MLTAVQFGHHYKITLKPKGDAPFSPQFYATYIIQGLTQAVNNTAYQASCVEGDIYTGANPNEGAINRYETTEQTFIKRLNNKNLPFIVKKCWSWPEKSHYRQAKENASFVNEEKIRVWLHEHLTPLQDQYLSIAQRLQKQI